jgi:hypothetical protein
MSRNITNELNKLATEQLGFKVELGESFLFTQDEANDIIEDYDIKPVVDDVLVHSGTNDDDTITTIITSDYPEYIPYIIIHQDEDDRIITVKDLR